MLVAEVCATCGYKRTPKVYTLLPMIARSHRFHGYGSLNAVYRRGQTAREPNVTLKFIERPGRDGRVAVVVSKKVSKSAVVRNRIRRRIYEIVRQLDAETPLHTDMVFTVFSDELAKQEQKRLARTIKELVKKATQNPDPTTRSQTPAHGIVKPEGDK